MIQVGDEVLISEGLIGVVVAIEDQFCYVMGEDGEEYHKAIRTVDPV